MTHLRRARFERVPFRSIRLTSDDLTILRALHCHRLLRSTDLIKLLGRSRQGMLRRLQLLFHHGFVDRPLAQLDWYARGSESMVYALGQKGARELTRREGLAQRRIRWDTKNGRLSRLFLRHTLSVAEVMVSIEVACRERVDVQFISPEEVLAGTPEAIRRLRLPFRWQVEIPWGGKLHHLGVEPDKVFGIQFDYLPENRRRAYFLLEADRGTMPVMRRGLSQTSFIRKLLGYWETWRQGLHRSHFGISNFRVLVVTTSRQRLEHLLEACRSHVGDTRLFLFADQAATDGGLLKDCWLDGKHETVRIFD